MSEGPVDEVTIQHITDAADVGHGTFYLHFKDKHALFGELADRAATELEFGVLGDEERARFESVQEAIATTPGTYRRRFRAPKT